MEHAMVIVSPAAKECKLHLAKQQFVTVVVYHLFTYYVKIVHGCKR